MNFALGLSFLNNLVVVLFILICLAIILIVLLQKGRGGGLSGAFGGGAAGSLLGTKTGDFLTWVTICLVAAFLVIAVLMGKFMRPTLPGAIPSTSAPITSEQADTSTADTQTPATETPSQEQTPASADTPSESVGDAEDVEVPAEAVPQVPAEPTN